MAKKKKNQLDLDIAFEKATYTDYDKRKEYYKEKAKQRKKQDQWVDFSTFEDGYDFGDVTKSILGTGTKVQQKFTKGVQSNLEGFLDTGTNWLSMGTEKLGWDKATKGLRNFAQKDFLEDADLVNKTLRVANPVLNLYAMGASAKENLSDGFDATDIGKTILQGSMPGSYLEDAFTGEKSAGSKAIDKLADYSVTGNKLDELTQTVGQITGQAALTGVGIPWQLTAFANSAGNEMNNAFQNNATAGQAFLSGLISGAVEVGTEYIGSGANKLFGMESLGSKALGKLGSKISNKAIQYITKIGFDGASEGLEEVLSGLGTAIGQKLTYMNDKDLNELYSSDQALDDFVMGALGSIVTNVPNSVRSVSRGENAFTGLTENEKTVLDKEIERRTNDLQKNGKELTKGQKKQLEESVQRDLQKGYISADFIEETLGKDFDRSKDNYLQESFRERIRSNFRANIDTSNVKNEFEKATLESANRFLDGTNKARETAEIIAKLSKDTNTAIEFTNNNSEEIQSELAKIKDKAVNKLTSKGMSLEEAKAKVDNRFKNATLNGMKISGENGNKILINADSPNMLAAITGHEITHLLENTNEYKKLRKLAYDYAKMQGDERSADVEDYGLYDEISDGDSEYLNQELTADLVGDYIVNNEDFIRNLYAKDRNVFQKVKDFIDDLVTRFTGTDEERKLRECQRSFERAIREYNKGQKNINQKATQETQQKKDNIQQTKEDIAPTKEIKYSPKTTEIDENDSHGIVDKINGVLWHIQGKKDTYIGLQDADSLINISKEAFRGQLDQNQGYTKYVINQLADGILQNAGIDSDNVNIWDKQQLTKEIGKIVETEQTKNDIAPVKEQVKEKPKKFTEVTDEDLFNINMEEVENQFDKQEYKLNEDIETENNPIGNAWDLDEYNFKLKDGNTLWINTPYEYGKNKDGSTNYNDTSHKRIDFTIEDSNGEIIDEYSIENEKGEFTRDDILNAIKHMTYDDSNKVADGQLDIFDNVHRNDGHRYSLSQDSQGRELSQEQQEYFKDSKVRDENGNLIVAHHGTDADFNTFRYEFIGDDSKDGFGFYFTPNELKYDYDYKKSVYLDIKNPATTSEQIGDILSRQDELYDTIKNKEEVLKQIQKEFGVDGIIDNERNNIVAFYPNQIKNVDNTNPTSNPDIRYSLSENTSDEKLQEYLRDARETGDSAYLNRFREKIAEQKTNFFNKNTTDMGIKLSNGQKNFFKDSKARGINDSLTTVYHTTTDEIAQFNEFNPVGTPYYRFGDTVVNYYTNSKEMSGSYASQDYTMADTKILNNVEEAQEYLNQISEETGNLYTLYRDEKGKWNLSQDKRLSREARDFLNSLSEEERQEMKDKIFTDDTMMEYNPDYAKVFSWNEFNKDLQDKYKSVTEKYLGSTDVVELQKEMINYLENPSWLKFENEESGTGIGYYDTEEQMLKNIKHDIQDTNMSKKSKLQYEGYVNITNPYIIDAEQRNWNQVVQQSNDFIDELEERVPKDVKNNLTRLYRESENKSAEARENYEVLEEAIRQGIDGYLSSVDENIKKVNNVVRKVGFREIEQILKGEAPGVQAWFDIASSLEDNGLIGSASRSFIVDEFRLPEQVKDLIKDNYNKKIQIQQIQSDNINKIVEQLGREFSLKELYEKNYENYQEFDKYRMPNYYFMEQIQAEGNDYLGYELNDILETRAETMGADVVGEEIAQAASVGFSKPELIRLWGTSKTTNDVVKEIIASNKDGTTNYDGVIIKNVYDYGGRANGENQANDLYITFNSNQFKAADNLNPTTDPDIRYSLSPSGEMQDSNGNKVTLETSDTGTTGTLMAIHNLSESKLRGILELGGFPVPSIAVTKVNNVGSNQFGDITVLFDKSTIDPAIKANEVYDRDVWTPTFPTVEYDIDNKMLRKMAKDNNFYEGNDDDIIDSARISYLYADNLAHEVNGYGIENVLDRMKKDNKLKYWYKKTIDNNYQPQMKPTKYSYDYSNETLKKYVDLYNSNKFNDMSLPDFYYHYLNYGDMNLTEDQQKALKSTVRDMILPEIRQEAELEYEKAKHRDNFKIAPISQEKFVEQYTNMMLDSFDNNYFKWKDFIKDASRLDEFGETLTVDEARTLADVEGNTNQAEYEKWIDDTFGKTLREAKKGIRNDKDIFTPSGNRRNFNQLHEDYNLQNVVKLMTDKKTVAGEEGFGAGSGFGTLQAQMSHKFTDIDDIRNYANERIVPNTEANDLLKPYQDMIYDDMENLIDYYKYKDEKYNYPMGTLGYALNDFAGYKNQNLANLKKVLNDYSFNTDSIPSELLNKVVDDINSLKTIPTDYFEAKPQRAVGLDEIQQVVIPNNLDADFKKQLQDKGIKYTEYDPNVEGDRQRVINQFDELKFSLSRQNDIAPIGGWNVRGSDIAFDENKIKNALTPVLAPIKESVDQLNKSLQELKQQNNLDDLTLDITPFLDMINGTEETNQLSPQNLEKAKETLVQQGVPVDAAQNFVQNMVNRFDTQFNKIKEKFTEKDLKKWQKMIATAQEAFTNRNAIIDKLAKDSGNQMIKYRGDLANNSFGQAQYNVETAQTDLNGNEIGKSINGLFEPAEKQGLGAVLDDYLFHKSNIERHAVGKGSQVPASVSEQLVRDYEKSYPQLKEWSKGFEKYFDNLLQLEVDSGLTDQDTYNLLRGEEGIYRSYIPFFENEAEKRYFDDAGNLRPIKPLKRARGGANQSKLMGMKQAMTKQTMAVWNSMRTNQLYQEIINTLGGEEGLGFIVRNDPSNLSQSLYTDQDGNKFLTAYVNGQEMSTKISNELYNELAKTAENKIKALEETFSPIVDKVQWVSNLRRNMLTSYNPMFALFKNPVKDIQDAVLYSKHTAGMLANLPSAYGELLTNKSKEAKQFRALYGGGEYTGFGKGYARVSEMIELAPRYAEYKASLKAGESVEQAIYNAREVTTNFGRGGYITKAMNRNGFTFLNASVQGFSKFYRNFAEQPNAGQFAMAVGKAAMLGVIPAIFNELAFGSGDDKDEDYEALPSYIKDNYYLFKLGDNAEYDDFTGAVISVGGSKFLRIPKGRALSVFGSAARRTIEYAEGDKDAFDKYLSNAWSQIGPVELGESPLDNTILAPIFQAYGGRKLENGQRAGRNWYGGDLVPTRLQGEKPEDQYDESTDKMSVWIGDKLSKVPFLNKFASPYKINYIIDQYSGALGDFGLPMITPETSNGAESFGDYLIAPIKDQVIVNSVDDNKYAGKFFDIKNKLYTGTKATDEDKVKAKYMDDKNWELSALYKEKREIQSDESLGKKEKYARVQAIQEQINNIAKEAINTYQDVTVSDNYAKVNDKEYYKNAEGKWTTLKDKDSTTVNTLGMNDSEKSQYFAEDNTIYNLEQKYKKLKEGKSDDEIKVLNKQLRQKKLEAIKSSPLSDNAKYAMYGDEFYWDKMTPYYEDLGFKANDIMTYKSNEFTADKDKYGESIKNSKKKKVKNYIFSMNIPKIQQKILYKKEYKNDTSYDDEIFNYINNSDLDYTSKTKILDELGIKYR